jgi:phosphoribosylformylglycinamidine synthase
MALAGDLGLELNLTDVPGAATDDAPGTDRDIATLCFSESNGRYLIEVRPQDRTAFEALLTGCPLALVGQVTPEQFLTIHGANGDAAIHAAVRDLEQAWRGAAPGPQPVRPAALAQPTPLPVIKRKPRVLILHASGTNRDHEAAAACDLAGGQAEIVHVNQLACGERRLKDYVMLVLPGGFSYSDDLGAGVLWAADLRYRFQEELTAFIAQGRAVLGICNGFQALVKSGVLPGAAMPGAHTCAATLTFNRSARFECRWVYLKPNPASPCVFTQGLDDLLYVPVAHGEGRFLTGAEETLADLQARQQIVLTYVNAAGQPADYPDNPNGSVMGIAGLCNPRGNVFGLMPHPEDHILGGQHPRWTRGEAGRLGLPLFAAGIRYVAEL